MKPGADPIQHVGTLNPIASRRMSIAVEDMPWVQKILTDLYSNPPLAVCREYVCNSLDSHLVAGNPDPIDVELPSDLRPVFVVTDNGVGMSMDDVLENYSKFGWSDKRQSNEVAGMLGLGCKAGLTYTSQFTLVARKDGMKNVVLVTRDADGAGMIQIVSSEPFDGPDGVSVQVPVKDVARFNQQANLFLRLSDPGTIRVDGVLQQTLWEHPEAQALDPDVILLPSTVLGQDMVTMGGVPYPTTEPLFRGEGRVLVRYSIGDLDPTPSREQLHYTPKTKDALKTARLFIVDRLVKHASREIDACPDRSSALQAVLRWRQIFRADYRWQGLKVPLNGFDVWGYEWSTHRSIDTPSERRKRIHPGEPMLLISGHKPKGITRQRKQQILDHAKAIGYQGAVLLTRDPVAPDWLAHWPQCTVADLPGNVTPPAPRPKSEPGYRTISGSGYLGKVKGLPADVCWTSDPPGGYLDAVQPTVIIRLYEREVAGFARRNPHVPTLAQVAERKMMALFASLSTWDKAASIDSEFVNRVRCLKGPIDDPDLFALHAVATFPPRGALAPREQWARMSALCRALKVTVPKVDDSKLVALKLRYPLLRHLHYTDAAPPFIDYVNAIYLATTTPTPQMEAVS